MLPQIPAYSNQAYHDVNQIVHPSFSTPFCLGSLKHQQPRRVMMFGCTAAKSSEANCQRAAFSQQLTRALQLMVVLGSKAQATETTETTYI